MDTTTLTTALPLIISACTLGLTTITGAIGAAWLYYRDRQTGRDKEGVISSAYTREQKRSKQVYDEASETSAQQQLILSFDDLIKQSIGAGNGQIAKLIEAEADNTKGIMFRLERIEASQNQIVIFLRERAGLSLVGGADIIDAATIRSDAVKRTAAIVEAVDANIQKVATDAIATDNVIAIVKAEPNDKA